VTVQKNSFSKSLQVAVDVHVHKKLKNEPFHKFIISGKLSKFVEDRLKIFSTH